MENKENSTIKIEIYQVDSFTKEMFKGNPAMVCILDKYIDSSTMQNIAFEVNLSETAFLVPKVNNEYEIRWFTPQNEVNLCGHATLAASKVLFNIKKIPYDEIVYHSKSGILKSKIDVKGITLDFPIDKVIYESKEQYRELLDAMGINEFEDIFKGESTRKLVIRLKNKEEVMSLKPKFEKMREFIANDIKGVGITAKHDNDKYDFVTRYFNPWVGVNEDSVTGSVHTLLAKYWGEVLNKRELKAYQLSKRGGNMLLRIIDEKRLEIIGDACIVFTGKLNLGHDNSR